MKQSRVAKGSAPSKGGFNRTAGQPITPPIRTTVDANGNARKSVGGSYKNPASSR